MGPNALQSQLQLLRQSGAGTLGKQGRTWNVCRSQRVFRYATRQIAEDAEVRALPQPWSRFRAQRTQALLQMEGYYEIFNSRVIIIFRTASVRNAP